MKMFFKMFKNATKKGQHVGGLRSTILTCIASLPHEICFSSHMERMEKAYHQIYFALIRHAGLAQLGLKYMRSS